MKRSFVLAIALVFVFNSVALAKPLPPSEGPRVKVREVTPATEPVRPTLPAAQPAAAVPVPVQWNDSTKTVNAGGQTWDLNKLTELCRANGVLSGSETLTPKPFGIYIALKINSRDWLRIGSIPSRPGQICRADKNGNPSTCWTVMSTGSWIRQ